MGRKFTFSDLERECVEGWNIKDRHWVIVVLEVKKGRIAV